jgi:hypothetical protein
MRNFKSWLLTILGLGLLSAASAHINPEDAKKPAAINQDRTINFRENCSNAVRQIDQALNNVRARLTTGGDVWWDGDDGRYVVPKVPAGQPEVSSLFAGAVWLGGVDPAGNLKVAAQTYGRNANRFDFWPGPIDPVTGTTDQEVCSKWDKFFVVLGREIDQHLQRYREAEAQGIEYDPGLIPEGVKGWPAKGNQFFFEVHQFDLPNTTQGLAGFYDVDGDGDYNPDLGDYPIIEIRGCPDPQYPDEMIFWIYNDAGNIHSQTQGDKIQMEVQVQAFSYATNDEINDMTFQRYKLINRAIESIDSTFFAMWADPDLGCYTDDYVGCDTLRSLAYVYNEDAVDGTTGCTCDQGVNTYCTEIPILGIDYFRGPLDENGDELGMSSFTYYNNSLGGAIPGTTDPTNALEYYRYLSGSWRDGSPFTYGDDAYQDGAPIKYAFTEAPDDPNGWSMCTAGLSFGDRRTVQASGPFRLDPGAVNELIVGVVWVPDQNYPCPSIRKLQEVDDIAQALFDNCFDITDGPDAPDIDWIELDQEIIAIFTNDTLTSNNAFEAYAELGLQIPPFESDSLYVFEGYMLFQLANSSTSLADRDDPNKVRLIYQVDVKNGVGKIFNWLNLSGPNQTPTEEPVYAPELKVDGADLGIRHTFRIREDQFAQGDRRLVNHKKYYFVAVAYAYNNYEPFDPKEVLGQRMSYLEGRRNIGDGENPFYTVIPRPITDRKLNARYGDGAIITRIDGIGNGGLFLDISDETRQEIEAGFADGNFSGEITYRPGRGPIEVSVFNPLDVKDGEFELTFIDENMANATLDNQVRWTLKSLTDPSAPLITSQRTIAELNEEIVKEFGFSVTIGQVPEIGAKADPNNGAVGYEEEYTSLQSQAWLRGIPDNFHPGDNFLDQVIFNYVANDPGEVDEILDPTQALNNIGPGYFVPYTMANWRASEGNLPYITPAWTDLTGSNIVRNQNPLANVNNVDIVLTSNRDLWSRCVIVESANRYYESAGFVARGGKKHFDLRSDPNVTKFDNDGDGRPDVDTADPGNGMGWFPGYAIDVETGQRLNIFFGENSVYNCENLTNLGLEFLCEQFEDGQDPGGDMMFNPTDQLLIARSGFFANVFQYLAGGQHFVYVTQTPYDECALFRDRFGGTGLTKVRAMREITWGGLVMMQPGLDMRSYQDGLIPEDVVIKLRVNNPYKVQEGTGDFKGYPTYRFKLEGYQASPLDAVGVETALDYINVVPNPYYGFSDYETTQFTTTVKITNLPAQCIVTIYTLDGKFIRRFTRDERGAIPVGNSRGIEQAQITPALEWDLKNSKGIPIASGVYLIHVKAEGLGERTLKWFGINRQFDPSGL